jgi:HlyD family secretion protein
LSLLSSRKFKFFLPLLLLFFAVVIAFFIIRFSNTGSMQVVKSVAIKVNSIQVKPDDYTPNVLLYGSVDSSLHAKVSSRISTEVVALDVKEGDAVKKNQSLLKLDDKDAMLIVEQSVQKFKESKVMLEKAKDDLAADKIKLKKQQNIYAIQGEGYQRKQDLFSSKIITLDEFDAAQALFDEQTVVYHSALKLVKSSEHQLSLVEHQSIHAGVVLSQARRQLQFCSVVSPFNGVVTQVNVAPFEFVNIGQNLVDILPDSGVEIRALLPQSNVPQVLSMLKSGIVVKGSALLVNGERVPIKLQNLTAQVRSGQLGREAVFLPTASTNTLVNGQPVSVLMSLPNVKKVFKVPISSIYREKKINASIDNYIYTIVNGRLKRVLVNVRGRVYDPQKITQVLIDPTQEKSLSGNDHILTSQVPGVISGLRVVSTKQKKTDKVKVV